VIDLIKGRTIGRVLAGDVADPNKTIPHRTHGAALTPDEKELWISDQDGKKIFIFNSSYVPLRRAGHIDLTGGGHGWVSFSRDGKYAWCHTPDVIDVKSRKIVATLKDDKGAPVSGSKFIEIDFRDGKVVAMGDQFGLG